MDRTYEVSMTYHSVVAACDDEEHAKEIVRESLHEGFNQELELEMIFKNVRVKEVKT